MIEYVVTPCGEAPLVEEGYKDLLQPMPILGLEPAPFGVKEDVMRSISQVSSFSMKVKQGNEESRLSHPPDPVTIIFKKSKALTDSTGEQLAGNELRPVYALHTEDNRQADVLVHMRLLDQMISSTLESSSIAGLIPIKKRWALQPVRRCAAGMCI